MVLRGAQFQRFGPAGCACLTRRALSLYSAMFMQEQSAAVDLPEEGRVTRGHLSGLHSGDQYWQPHNKDSRRRREQVTYVMGILGNRHRTVCYGGDADRVHSSSFLRSQRGRPVFGKGRRRIGREES